MSKDIPQEIKNFIASNGIMTLASHLEDTWVATVYYGTDADFNIYIVTDPDSKHGKQIKQNPNIAFAIFDSHTKITEGKKGIQGQGVCGVVKSPTELLKGLTLWHRANPGIEHKITLDTLKKAFDTKLYRVEPTLLKFFNKELYGEKEYGIWSK